jgi:ribosome-binding protein aMBF1 (putative translation factor)
VPAQRIKDQMKKKTSAKKTKAKRKVAKTTKKFKRVIDPAMAKIGSRIREIREAQGLTIAGLAKKLGTSGSSLGQIENGWRVPSAKALDKVAKALKVPQILLVAGPAHYLEIASAMNAWSPRRK